MHMCVSQKKEQEQDLICEVSGCYSALALFECCAERGNAWVTSSESRVVPWWVRLLVSLLRTRVPAAHRPSPRCRRSAGGTGVLLNVDRVAQQLEEMGHHGIQVRGLADSGWFLDNKQYRRTDCIDTITCAPTEAIRRGIR